MSVSSCSLGCDGGLLPPRSAASSSWSTLSSPPPAPSPALSLPLFLKPCAFVGARLVVSEAPPMCALCAAPPWVTECCTCFGAPSSPLSPPAFPPFPLGSPISPLRL
eukprot:1221263-Pyramimonas_sp.AAC.1